MSSATNGNDSATGGCEAAATVIRRHGCSVSKECLTGVRGKPFPIERGIVNGSRHAFQLVLRPRRPSGLVGNLNTC